MTLKIRTMKQEDILRVIELEKKIFTDPWPERSFYLEIETSKISRSYVLLKDSTICGFAILWEFADELHIGNFAIDNELQGKGLGSFLLSSILERHKYNHVVFLEVRKSNSPAIGLYKNLVLVKLTYVRTIIKMVKALW